MGARTDTALSRLLSQFASNYLTPDTNLRELFKAILLRFEDTDAILDDLLNKRDIETATGIWLDNIGEIMGFPRPANQVDPSLVFEMGSIGDAGPDYNVGMGWLEDETEYILDNDMESGGTIDWTAGPNAGLLKVGFPVFEGTQSMRILDAVGPSTDQVYAEQSVQPNPFITGPMTASIYMYDTGLDALPYLRVDGGAKVYAQSGLTDQWQKVTVNFSWGGGITPVVFRFGFDPTGSGNFHFFDLASFRLDEIGGQFDSLTGLPDGTLADDDTYRQYLNALAQSRQSSGSIPAFVQFVQDTFNPIGITVLDVKSSPPFAQEPGEIILNTAPGLIGYEKTLVRLLGPILAGCNVVILN